MVKAKLWQVSCLNYANIIVSADTLVMHFMLMLIGI